MNVCVAARVSRVNAYQLFKAEEEFYIVFWVHYHKQVLKAAKWCLVSLSPVPSLLPYEHSLLSLILIVIFLAACPSV